MPNKIIFILLVVVIFAGCQKSKKPQDYKPKAIDTTTRAEAPPFGIDKKDTEHPRVQLQYKLSQNERKILPKLKDFDLIPPPQKEPEIIRPQVKRADPKIQQKQIKPPPKIKKEKDIDIPKEINKGAVGDYFAKLIIKGPKGTSFSILHPSGSSWVSYTIEGDSKELAVPKMGLNQGQRYYYYLRIDGQVQVGQFRRVEFGFGQTVTVDLK